MNNISITGRIGSDPEHKSTSTGKAVCKFSVAVNRPVKNANGESEADWFRVEAWGQTADYVANYLEKGRLVAVTGRMQCRKYQDKQGQNRESWELIAERVEGLDRPKDDAPKAQPSRRPAAQTADEWDPFGDE